MLNQLPIGCTSGCQICRNQSLSAGFDTKVPFSFNLKFLVHVLQQNILTVQLQSHCLSRSINRQRRIDISSAEIQLQRINRQNTVVQFGCQHHIFSRHCRIDNQLFNPNRGIGIHTV